MSEKFTVDKEATFEMQYANLDTFFKGLDGILGRPIMIDGSLLKRMEYEHCRSVDSLVKFARTTNGKPKPKCTASNKW